MALKYLSKQRTGIHYGHVLHYIHLFVLSQSAELFTLTYGATVAQLVRDLETPDEVNKQLDKM